MTDLSQTDNKPPQKILVIDDDHDLCRVMALVLAENGFQTFQADSGEEGLKLFHAEHPDLVLLDVALPGIDGFEVAAQIRQSEADQHTIIVIITAYSQSFLVSSEMQTGIDSYLTKPVVLTALVTHVADLLALPS